MSYSDIAEIARELREIALGYGPNGYLERDILALATRLEAHRCEGEHDLAKCLRTRCRYCGQKACAHYCDAADEKAYKSLMFDRRREGGER